jgi:hypothetical protein
VSAGKGIGKRPRGFVGGMDCGGTGDWNGFERRARKSSFWLSENAVWDEKSQAKGSMEKTDRNREGVSKQRYGDKVKLMTL